MSEKKMDWAKFDKDLDLDSLQEDVKEASNGDFGDYPDIPDGKYEVVVEKLELGKSKPKDNGTGEDPMLIVWFTILEGEFKDSKLFHYKVMQPQNQKAWGIQVHQNLEMLRNLWDADKEEVTFESMSQLDDLVLDIAEEIIDDEWEYIIEKTTKKGFSNITVVEILAAAE